MIIYREGQQILIIKETIYVNNCGRFVCLYFIHKQMVEFRATKFAMYS